MTLKHAFLSTCALVAAGSFGGTTLAAPTGGTVRQGSATITSSGKTTTINQSSQRALIDWRGFDIAPDETTRFRQPSASSLTVNRVNSVTPSEILGTVSANGNIVIINPNGVFFGPGSRVDVNGLVATTANIRDADFAAGRLDFTEPGKPGAAIINTGTITAKQAGLVGLVAPHVVNSGTISAHLGKVQLASGDTFALDLYGDRLINIEVGGNVPTQTVVNTGAVSAAGGTIELTAAAGRNAVNSLILTAGTLEAPTAEAQEGKIIIRAAGSNAVAGNIAAEKGIKSGASAVIVDGYVNASGYGAGQKGGTVEITGDHIALQNNALINASGDAGGGNIKIGGDYLGTGTTSASLTTDVAKKAVILNNAITKGDGGRTIVWSDGDTRFHGAAFGRGGKEGGNGGFVETSGKKHLDAQGFVDLSAPKGEKGDYLLDPDNITIYGNVDPRFVSTDGTTINLANGLALWLDPSDRTGVILSYAQYGGVTASGTLNGHTITTSTDISGDLAVGSRIRLIAGGADAAADTLGSHTYTITAIAGTSITVAEALTQTYSGDDFYRGLVATVTDKSTNGNDATQTDPTRRPLWVGDVAAYNNQDVFRTDGAGDYMRVADDDSLDGTNGLTVFLGHSRLAGGGLGGILSKRVGFNDQASYSFFYNGNDLNIDFDGSNNRFGVPGYSNPTNNFFTIVYDGSQAQGARVRTYAKGEHLQTNGEDTASIPNYGGDLFLGTLDDGGGFFPNYADFQDSIIYRRVLTENEQYLVEQYMSAKWGHELTPNGGGTEVSRATDAVSGYSVFAADYLERLSLTANIHLQATQNITFDLQGDSLDFTTSGRSLTLTAGNQIRTASAGEINTNNGAITFNATNGIVLNHALDLNSTGGTITMTNNVTLGANQNWDAGTGSLVVSGTVNGGFDLTASAATITQSAAWGGSTPLDAVSLTSTNALSLRSISAGSIFARTTGAAANLTILGSQQLAASGTGDAITLVSGQHFINSAGASALSAPAGRWLVYSTNPASDTIGSLANDFRRFSCTFGGSCPTFDANENGLLYSFTPTLTVTPDATHITYGDDPATALTGYAYTASGYLGDDDDDDILTGTLTGTTDYVLNGNVGTYRLDYDSGTLTSAMGYNVTVYADNATGLVVDKKDVSVAFAAPLTRIYGSNNPTLTFADFTFTGLINGGHNALFTSITPDWNGVTNLSDVGTYNIDAIIGSTTNYNVTTTPATTLTIGKKDVSVAFAAPLTRIYGSNNPTLTFADFTFTGLINGGHNALFTSITPDWNGVTNQTGVGSHAIGAALADTTNYHVLADPAGTLNITKKALSIRADDTSRNAGAANPAFTASFTGLTPWDTSSGAVSGLQFTTPANSSSAPGTYAIIPSGATSANYVLSYVNGVLTVLQVVTPPPPPPSGHPSLPNTVSLKTQGIQSVYLPEESRSSEPYTASGQQVLWPSLQTITTDVGSTGMISMDTSIDWVDAASPALKGTP